MADPQVCYENSEEMPMTSHIVHVIRSGGYYDVAHVVRIYQAVENWVVKVIKISVN